MPWSLSIGGLAWAVLALAGASTSVDAQPLWTSPVNFDDASDRFSVLSNFAFDSQGYVHANWIDFKSSSYRLRYATNRSGSWTTSTIPLPGVNYRFADPRLVITPDDVIHVFFAAQDSSGQDPGWIWEVTKPAGGGSWTTPLKISFGQGGNGTWAAVDDSGGIYVVWTWIRFDPNRGENRGRYKPLGGSWGPMETIRVSGYGWPGNNWVSSHGNKFYIGYNTADHKPYLRVRNPDGTFDPERTLSNEGAVPKVVENPVDGALEAVFGHDWGLWTTRSTDGGITWESPSPLSANQPPQWDTGGDYLHRNATIAVDAKGDVHVLWQVIEDEGDPAQTFYRSRIRGLWRWEYSLSDAWTDGGSGADPGSLVTDAADVHAMFIGAFQPGHLLYMIKPGTLGPDTTPPPQVTNASIDIHRLHGTIWWTNPDMYDDFVGTMVRYSTSGYPAGPNDGMLLCDMAGGPGEIRSCDHDPMPNGVGYYYSLFTYDDLDNYSPSVQLMGETETGPDFDKDDDVDQADYAYLQRCFSGVSIPQNDPACEDAKLDEDNDVDDDDYQIFEACLSGPNVELTPGCLLP